MKTLYISDLDGTLLKSDERTSDFTNSVINRLTSKGMLFSYATARSVVTASKVTSGLVSKIPLITYNGASIVENVTGRILYKTSFSPDQSREILAEMLSCGVYPQVYSYIGGVEKFSYIYGRLSPEHRNFIVTRRGDPRDNPVKSAEELVFGDVFYFTCIDSPNKLEPIYRRFCEKYKCLYERNDYTGDKWLEIIPKGISKAGAALRLKELLKADRIVSFGNGLNDRELFEISDESYAVSNADSRLKETATGVVASNDEDGVAKFLLEIFKEDI